MKRIAITLLCGALAACDRQREPSAGADSTAAYRTQDSLAFAASGDALIARWRARVPDSVFVRKGACPFECCGYTEWALRDSAVVVIEPRRGAATAFVLPDSTRFMADSGFVRVTDVQLIVVGDTNRSASACGTLPPR
ncbi:MAG: hypothetical protein WEE89_07960 [Gemmatimonadota bacterium]